MNSLEKTTRTLQIEEAQAALKDRKAELDRAKPALWRRVIVNGVGSVARVGFGLGIIGFAGGVMTEGVAVFSHQLESQAHESCDKNRVASQDCKARLDARLDEGIDSRHQHSRNIQNAWRLGLIGLGVMAGSAVIGVGSDKLERVIWASDAGKANRRYQGLKHNLQSPIPVRANPQDPSDRVITYVWPDELTASRRSE